MIIITDSFQYLDPGTGSYLYQVLIAAGITAGIYFRNLKFFVISWVNKVKNFFKRKFKNIQNK